MAKALVLVPFALDEAGIDNRRAQLKAVKLGPDIAFDFRPVTAGPTSFMSPHDWALMDMAIFEAGLSAEDDGYDAVCIDTMSDSGMLPLRSMLSIPVISPGKASMLFALTLGEKFGLLAQWQPAILRNKKALAEWGLAHRCAAIESYDSPPDFSNLMSGKEDEVFPKMQAAAERAIAAGADVICLGSTTMHQAAAFLACAPKSNAVYKAFGAAQRDAQDRGSLGVPPHLRNAPTKLAEQMGHGAEYRYAHDEEGAYAAGETYFPEELGEQHYYHPVNHGLEIKIGEKLERLRALDAAAFSAKRKATGAR